jgi:hypothetical protein
VRMRPGGVATLFEGLLHVDCDRRGAHKRAGRRIGAGHRKGKGSGSVDGRSRRWLRAATAATNSERPSSNKQQSQHREAIAAASRYAEEQKPGQGCASCCAEPLVVLQRGSRCAGGHVHRGGDRGRSADDYAVAGAEGAGGIIVRP